MAAPEDKIVREFRLGAMLFGMGCIAAGFGLERLAIPRLALVLPVAVSALYLVLAVKYWFRIPVAGTAIALLG